MSRWIRRWIRAIGKLARLSAARKAMLLEAGLYLAAARLLLWILPFQRLTRFFKRTPSTAANLTPADRRRLHLDIRWAIKYAAVCLPGRTVCFPRAIAAQAMCRRRGVTAVLCYGAAPSPVKGLMAHVWVLDGAEGVVGHEIAGDFKLLARFPEERVTNQARSLKN